MKRKLKLADSPPPEIPVGPLPLVTLILVTLVLFSRAFTMGYVTWDDNVMIQENVILQMPFWSAIRASFGGFYHGDYLPLTLMSFWADVKIFGFNPRPAHVENLLLHALNVGLLYLWLRELKLSKTLVLFICAVFAWHPVQAESVYWISERKGLLCLTFLLIAMVGSARADSSSKPPRGYMVYVFCYIAAFFCKAAGIFVPIFLIFVDRFLNVLSTRRVLVKHLPVLAIGFAAAVLRFIAYQSSLPTLSAATFSFERIISWPLIAVTGLGFYLRLFFAPGRLSIIYPPFSMDAAWGLYFGVGLAGIALFAYLKRKIDGPLPWLFALLTFLFLLPVLQIVPRLNFVNDRYLYIPIIGLAGLVGLAGGEFLRVSGLNKKWGQPGVAALMSALLLPLIFISFSRAEAWASSRALWADTVQKNPTNGLARNNYAQELQAAGDIEGAVREYGRALDYGKADGTDNLAYNNLGIVLSSPEYPRFFDLNRAADLLRRGIEASPRPDESFTLRFNLGHVYLQMGDRGRALQTFTELEALLENSNNQRYSFLLGKTHAVIRSLSGLAP